jgi:IS4 transposase
MAALIAVRSHLIAAAAFGPYATSEYAYAKELWPVIPDDSLTIVDRNYLAAAVVVGLERGGTDRHWLMRANKTSKWRMLQSFGPYDKLVPFDVSSVARTKDPTLPATFTARAIGCKHADSKGRQWLLTSLKDPVDYPAGERVALYHERWEIELGYDEIKTHMLERKETIRSQTVVGVRQELWGILLIKMSNYPRKRREPTTEAAK